MKIQAIIQTPVKSLTHQGCTEDKIKHSIKTASTINPVIMESLH